MGLTKKQKKIYDYIKSYTQEQGYSPTQKEIKEHFGFKSFGSVQRYLKYLREAHLLSTDWNARRGIQVLEDQLNLKASFSPTTTQDSISEELPLLGSVAAGNPIEAIENPTETTFVPKSFLDPKAKHFALTVKGDSMIEDGIIENDTVIIRQQENAQTGQTVVAIIDGEATLKKYYPQIDQIELHPANSRLSPLVVKDGDFRLIGILVGLLRSYTPAVNWQ